LGKRKGSHGAGQWALPGGHLEHGQSLLQGALTELEEETGYRYPIVSAVQPTVVTNSIVEGKHYVLFLFALTVPTWPEPTFEVREPEKCEEWRWFNLLHLPQPLYSETRQAIMCYLAKERFNDNLLRFKTGAWGGLADWD
jgi:8-oxo-dGTP diphosphatase